MASLVLDLDHVRLAAPRECEAEARVFFGESLGLAELDKPRLTPASAFLSLA